MSTLGWTMRLLSSALLAGILSACGGSSPDEAASEETGTSDLVFEFPTNWQAILRCDGGSFVVDVNTFERRMIQVVVNDRGVSRYLWEQAKASSERSGLTSRFDGIAGQMTEPNTLNQLREGKLIIRAALHNGIFDPNSFQGMQNIGYSGIFIQNSGTSISARGQRSGDEFKLVLNRERSTSGHCTGHISPSTGGCEGGPIRYIEAEEAANWIFRGCYVP